jgi:hypothetical protein
MTGGVAQVVERLPDKHKSLSSNPIPPQKKKKERKLFISSRFSNKSENLPIYYSKYSTMIL